MQASSSRQAAGHSSGRITKASHHHTNSPNVQLQKLTKGDLQPGVSFPESPPLQVVNRFLLLGLYRHLLAVFGMPRPWSTQRLKAGIYLTLRVGRHCSGLA